MVEKDVTGLFLTDGASGFLPGVLFCLGMGDRVIRVKAPARWGLEAQHGPGRGGLDNHTLECNAGHGDVFLGRKAASRAYGRSGDNPCAVHQLLAGLRL